MNPLHWVRWKVVILLAVVGGGFYVFGMNPLARKQINDLGTGDMGARWNIRGLSISLLNGYFDAQQLAMATPRSFTEETDDERVLSAAGVRFDVNMDQLLRRRFHGEVHITAPKLQIERRPDGTINVGDIGGEPQDTSSGQPIDWVEAIEKWLDKLKDWNETRRKIQEKIDSPDDPDQPAGPEQDGPAVDYERRITYPFEAVARFAATRIVGDGLEIEFVDRSNSKTPFPSLVDGKIEIENITDNPASYPEPIRWTLSGTLAGAPLRITGEVDLRQQGTTTANDLNLQVEASGLPLKLANLFAGKSLPMLFTKGKLDLRTDIQISDLNSLDVRPLLRMNDVKARPRPGKSRIAGIRARDFCKAFNEVKDLEIADMFVTGSFADPEIHLGDTLKNLVLDSTKKVARRKLNAELDRGTTKLKNKLQEELEDSGAGDLLKDVPIDLNKGLDGGKSKLRNRLNGFLR